MSTRTYILPKQTTRQQTTSQPVRSQQNNSQPTLNEVSHCGNKYIVLFKPTISLESLTLKNVGILNTLQVKYLITAGENNKLSPNMMNNSIRGFIYLGNEEDHDTRIHAIIGSIVEVLNISTEKIEYEITQCAEKLLAHALGITIEQEEERVVVPPSKLSNTAPLKSPTNVNVRENRQRENDVYPIDSKMQKAMLRQ